MSTRHRFLVEMWIPEIEEWRPAFGGESIHASRLERANEAYEASHFETIEEAEQARDAFLESTCDPSSWKLTIRKVDW